MLSKFKKSIEDYNEALLIDPANSEVFSKRGFSHLMLKNFDKACNDWSRAGELGDLDAYDAIKKFCNN